MLLIEKLSYKIWLHPKYGKSGSFSTMPGPGKGKARQENIIHDFDTLIKRSEAMKLHYFARLLVVSLAVCVVAGMGSYAQEAKKSADASKDPRKEYSEADRPEENYLARFQAIDVSQRLMRENLEQIYVLKVTAANFKDQGWEKDHEQIYAQYKRGVGNFYKRDVIYARVELEKNKKTISELFKKISEFYRGQTEEMLNNCADVILNLSLDEKSQADPNKNKTVFRNMARLRIGYGQLDDAQSFYDDGLYQHSIYHYRIAKTYCIRILEELDPANSKGKFEVHKADNLNRVYAPAGAKAAGEK